MQAVKFADGSDDTIEGLLMPYGGPANGRDLTGEYFSPRTNFALDWFSERPLLYQHGLDADVRLEAVGTIKAVELRDSGGWMQAQLKKSSAYWSEIKQLVDAGMWIRLVNIHTIREITPNGPLDHGVYEAGARSYVHWRAVDIDTGSLCLLTIGELSALIREAA